MATFDILSTFSTQRYDPTIRRQASSILDSVQTADAITTNSHHTITSSRVSASTIKEPSTHGQCLGRILSNLSTPTPPSSAWHESHSVGISTLINTDFSESRFSPSPSTMSFHLSVGRPSMTGENGEKDFVAGVKEQLVESLLSVDQVEAHIPPRTSLETQGTMASEDDVGDRTWRQPRPLPPLPVRVVNDNRDPSPQTPLFEMITPPSISHRFHQVHPEYDSDYDEYTDDTGSMQSSLSGIIDDESEDGDGLDFCDPELASPNQIISTSTPSNVSVDLNPAILPSPLPSSFSSSSSSSSSQLSPIQFRSPSEYTVWDGTLPGVYEEELPLSETALRPLLFTNPTHPTSSQPNIRESLFDVVSPSFPASSTAERNVWWRVFPKYLWRITDGRPLERKNEVNVGEKRTEAPRSFRPSYEARQMGSPSLDSEKRSQDTPPHPLPSAVPNPPPNNGQNQHPQSTSVTLRMLSFIFPCIPVSQEGGEIDEGKPGPAQGRSGAATLDVTSLGEYSMNKGREETRGFGLTKQKSTRTLLEVKIDRQVNQVIDCCST